MAVQDDDETPLDPAQERLRLKLVRLLFVSGGIMMLGLIAVFAAIVYKVSDGGRGGASLAEAGPQGAAADGSAIEATIPVQRGARILSADLDGERALLRLEGMDGSVTLVLVDLPSGRVLGRYAIRGE